MIRSDRPAVLGKIAHAVARALALRARTGAPGGTTPTRLAQGAGWFLRRRPVTPGSLLLGNPGQSFACLHAHGAGDCCIGFRFSPELVRLRAAALHVAADEARIIDAAGAAGFEDLSNFRSEEHTSELQSHLK